jgi:FtsH-binding integral membrane protein
VLVGVLVGAIHKMSAVTATLVFIFYSILNGVTLSSIFFVFTAESISNVFFIAAGTFAVMSAYGYFTKSDLTKLGNILFMALIGLVNMFLKSEMLYWISSYAGVLIFVGLIAYDTQKLKKLNVIGNEDTDEGKKEAIIGALTLYLDFINLFLYLLRIFGKRR